ncbi:MAG: LD-carboxypeptidase [Blastocatellales bacterium]|nr:LD-carboxypeptidase [Blastocatellales bacterium]
MGIQYWINNGPEMIKPVVKPAALEAGDLVAIIAPSSNLKADYLERGVRELKRLGLRVGFEQSILDKHRYTAGSDLRRARELMDAFTDPEVKAVWAARGGYGAMRLMGLLDDEALAANPKIFIGYSDITALHLYFYRRFGWVTFHGPMAAKDVAGGEEHYDRRTLTGALGLNPTAGVLGEIASGLATLHGGESGGAVTGRLLGGCLTLVTAMAGTPDALDARGAILFLEDTATRPYAIDRMLQQLRLSGGLDGVRAIVFGEMADCVQSADQGYTLAEVLADCTSGLGVPVLFGLKSGHSTHKNLTLPLGVRATVDPVRAALRIDEPAVS